VIGYLRTTRPLGSALSRARRCRILPRPLPPDTREDVMPDEPKIHTVKTKIVQKSDKKPAKRTANTRGRPQGRAKRTRAPRSGRERITERQWMVYLDCLARYRTYTLSADAAGLSTQSVRDERNRNPEFAAAETDAKNRYLDRLKKEALRRGAEGWVERGIFSKDGEHLGDIVKYSDALLTLLLKRHDKKFVERVDASVTSEVKQTTALDFSNMTTEEKRMLLTLLKKAT